MRRATPDQIIAHAALLRAVDRLLEQANEVRERRDNLDRLFGDAERAARQTGELERQEGGHAS